MSLSLGCRSDPHVFIKRVWPDDQVALVVVANVDNVPLERSPRLFTSAAAARLSFPTNIQMRVHVRTYLPPSEGGPDFERCGLRFGGSGGQVQGEQSSWVSDVLSSDQDATITLKPASGTARTDFDLRFVSCDPSAYACDAIRVSRFPTPFRDVTLRTVAAVRDDLAFVGVGKVRTATASVIGRVEGGAITELSGGFENLGEIASLAYDGQEHVYGVTEKQKLFRMDLMGRVERSEPLAPGQHNIAVGRDGTVVSYGENGIRVIAGDVPAMVASRIASLMGDVQFLGVAASDRMIAVNSGYFTFFTGTTWKEEREIRPATFETFYALGVDPSVIAAVGRYGLVVMRNESDGSWSTIRPPTDASGTPTGTSFYAVRGIGPGRFLVGGQFGFIGLWHGRGWCALPTMTEHRFEAIDLSPSGRVAYAVSRDDGAHDGLGPAVLRIDLPAPPP